MEAGVYRASSITVAEAAKIIENTQRDLNIALMNELAFIFHRIGIDTVEVLEAAGTKWNFLPFRPGLVGGHCIGVDPYYLTHKADKIGYQPQVILAGRRIKDGMGKHVAEQTVKRLILSGLSVRGADINVLGLTFKENCPDLRNSRVIEPTGCKLRHEIIDRPHAKLAMCHRAHHCARPRHCIPRREIDPVFVPRLRWVGDRIMHVNLHPVGFELADHVASTWRWLGTKQTLRTNRHRLRSRRRLHDAWPGARIGFASRVVRGFPFGQPDLTGDKN